MRILTSLAAWGRPVFLVGAVAVVVACDGGSNLAPPTQGLAAKIVIVGGDPQTAAAGAQVPDSLVVRVTDSKDQPVPGQSVAFVTSAGTVSPAAVTTNADGRAGTSWVLGPNVGPQMATATVTGNGVPAGLVATFHATASAPAPPPSATVATDLGPFVNVSGCTITDLSSYYYSTAYDVNSAGVVVGETECVSGETLTFRWSQATGMQQLANYPGGYGAKGGKINEGGYIAALYSTNNTYADFHPIIWTPGNTRLDLAPSSCPPDSCSGTPPTDINDDNTVIGGGADANTPPWLWTATGGLVTLTALGNGSPVSINRAGDIAAAMPSAYPTLGATAILTATGTLTPISGIAAQDMNDQQEVVGATGSFPNTAAVVWTATQGVHVLGTLGGTTSSAYGVNNHGEVVGSSTTGNGDVHAFYWTAARGMVDLGPGIAYAISDAGHMVGIAPTAFSPPDIAPDPLWQATMWQGTGGVPPSLLVARVATAPTGRTASCLGQAVNWQSRVKMFRCLAKRP